MFLRLLPLFIIIPLVEMYIIIQLGKSIGVGYTILIILGTGFAGWFLVKQQGWQTVNRVRCSLADGQLPGNEMLEGLLILVGAVLMLTPGLLTDTWGLTLLLPMTRGFYREILKSRLKIWLGTGRLKVYW